MRCTCAEEQDHESVKTTLGEQSLGERTISGPRTGENKGRDIVWEVRAVYV